VRIPGQIITFIWFAEEDISKIQHLSYVSGDTPGLDAMIETLERPLTVAKTYDRVVVGGSLFIRPVQNLGFGFTQLIEDNEASELAELEAISDTSRISEVMDDVEFENDSSENGDVSSYSSSSSSSTSL
jgi:hypothetical protein